MTKTPTRPSGTGPKKAARAETAEGATSPPAAQAAVPDAAAPAPVKAAPSPVKAAPDPAAPVKAAPAPDPAVGAPAKPAGPTAQPSPDAPRRPRTVSPPPVAPAQPAGSSFGGLVTAGLVGGLIAGVAFIAYDRIAAPAGAPATAAIEQRLAAVEASAADALSAAREAGARPIPEIPQAAIDAAAQGVAELRTSVSALEGRVATLDSGLAALRADPGAAERDADIRLAAADHIAAALAGGRPYAAALATLSAHGAPSDRVAALAPFAESGAPGAQALIERIEAAIVEAAAQAPQPGPTAPDLGGGFLQRLAERAITVEAVEAGGAPARPDALAEAERALRAGDHAGALAALAALPEPARLAAAGPMRDIEARIAAEEAARAIADDALAALAAGR